MSEVHYKTDPEPFALRTACQAGWFKPPLQTSLPRNVTCSSCLDWIAANHKAVIAQVEALRP